VKNLGLKIEQTAERNNTAGRRQRFHTDLGPLQGSSLPVDLWAGKAETQLS